jgi:hypothetical protein
MRSAMPPEMIAGMAAAKVHRKKNFTSPDHASGMRNSWATVV